MLTLILGRAGSGKTALIMEEIRTEVLSERPGCLLIVPEQYSHEAERELCAVCGDSLSLYAEVLSFTRLASRLADEYGGSGVRQLDKGGRLLCMARALESVSPALRVFSSAARRPELQKSLLDTVEELKSACVGAEELRDAALRCSRALSDKLGDLALIAEAYDNAVLGSGADARDRLERASELIREKDWGRGRRVYIDGFMDFTGQELRLIGAMLSSGAAVTVCLTADEALSEEMFAPSVRTVHALTRLAQELGERTERRFIPVPAEREDSALRFLEEHMFSFGGARFEGENDRIRLYTADSVAEECELAAAQAVSLARDRGARWGEIAVAARGYEDYRPALEYAFARYGVPLYSTRRSDILKKPLPTLILSAFELVQGGWKLEDMLSYLKTGLCGLTQEECDGLSAYAWLWNLHGGAWTAEEPWSLHPDGSGGQDTDEARERLAALDGLRRRVAGPLRTLGQRGRAAGTIRDHLEILDTFFEEISLAENLERRAREQHELGLTALAAESEQLWSLTVGAMEQCAEVLGDLEMDQERFARLFALLLSQYDVGTIPVSLDSVIAGDMDRMRRRSIRWLIVLGCSEDRLPAPSDTPGVLSEDERDVLSGLGLALGAGGGDIYHEFMLIYNCLTLPSEGLTLCHPLHDSGGGQLGPSFVYSSVREMFALEPRRVDRDRLHMNAPQPALELAASGHGARRLAAEAWFERSGQGGRLQRLREAGRLTRGRLSGESVRLLYGQRLHLTASRAESFASCRYRYFLSYGLRAKPRQQAGFDPTQAGTFLHAVLEQVSRAVMDRGGFRAVTDEELTALTDEAVSRYVSEKLNDFQGRTERFIYLFRRLTESVRRIVQNLAEEMRRSEFEPLAFELSFSNNGDLPAISMGDGELRFDLTGIADRVDGWVKGDKLYVRVVDYKTGKKAFSLSDVYSGLGLQMLLYLFALSEEGERFSDRQIVPAGVLYAPARDVTVPTDSRPDDETLASERQKKLQRSGLLLNDPAVLSAMESGETPVFLPSRHGRLNADALASAEQLGLLSRYVRRILKELAGELQAGSIEADPYFRSVSDNSCVYCEFASVCHFGEAGETYRERESLKAEETWERMAESLKEEREDG